MTHMPTPQKVVKCNAQSCEEEESLMEAYRQDAVMDMELENMTDEDTLDEMTMA